MNLSIIIPAHNNNIKLSRLLETIPVIDDIEVLVVDDGKVPALNLRYKYPHVFFYKNENGKGAGGARNTGLKYAKGLYVLFADSDDVFVSGWIDNVTPYIKANVEDIIFFSPLSFIENNLNEIGTRHLRYEKCVNSFLNNANNRDNIRYYFYVPWSKLIKRELIVVNQIEFEEIIASNDLMFSLKVGLHAVKIAASPVNIYRVEQGDSSMVNSLSVSNLTCRLDALFRYNSILDCFKLSNKKLMMAPWLLKLFRRSFFIGLKYLIRGIVNKTPLFFDHRFKS